MISSPFLERKWKIFTKQIHLCNTSRLMGKIGGGGGKENCIESLCPDQVNDASYEGSSNREGIHEHMDLTKRTSGWLIFIVDGFTLCFFSLCTKCLCSYLNIQLITAGLALLNTPVDQPVWPACLWNHCLESDPCGISLVVKEFILKPCCSLWVFLDDLIQFYYWFSWNGRITVFQVSSTIKYLWNWSGN